MLSPSLEDYLEEIYRLSLKERSIRVTDIAACLHVSLPSVTRALQRLNEKEYITYYPYKDILLTEKGNTLGDFLVKRNKIIRQFLKLMGAQCDVAAEAEAMEHYLSLPTVKAIVNFVDFTEQNPAWLNGFKHYCRQKEDNI